jgi:hypothetical protein
MNLKLHWNARQIGRGILLLPVSFTAVLTAVCVFRLMNFYQHGLGMYPPQELPHLKTFFDVLRFFWVTSLFPLVPWYVATLPVDVVVRRMVYKLHE